MPFSSPVSLERSGNREQNVSRQHRAILCLLSILLACASMAGLGGSKPAQTVFHQWYEGLLVTFLVFFMVSMFLTLKGKLAKSVWPIPISAALSYPTASLAYVAYFAICEPRRMLSSLQHVEMFDFIGVALFWIPTASGVWLFGAIAGFAFFLGTRIKQHWAGPEPQPSL